MLHFQICDPFFICVNTSMYWSYKLLVLKKLVIIDIGNLYSMLKISVYALTTCAYNITSALYHIIIFSPYY